MPTAKVHLTFKLGVIGDVTFTQADRNRPVDIIVSFKSTADAIHDFFHEYLHDFLHLIHINPALEVDGLHAVHINTYGDISGGARTTGPIFNPNVMAPNPAIGQLDAVDVRDGQVESHQRNNLISLFDGENCIIGRSVVVYSQGDPAIGDAIAWGIIGVTPEN